jgi:hypothetical protein
MAEALAAIGVIASVTQLADYGFKLSVKLFSYSEAVNRADKSVQSLSNEVSLTSAVLKELAGILQEDEAKLINQTALEATSKTTNECLLVFQELGKVLEKSLSRTSEKKENIPTIRIREKLKWPFMQAKVDVLRANLDRLKASLTLMLQVLCYAKDLTSR